MTGMSERPLKVLVVGTGVYVCGRGTEGYGTILPALYEGRRQGMDLSVRAVGTCSESARVLLEKNRELGDLFGFDLSVDARPSNGRDPHAYRRAIDWDGTPDCAVVCVPDHLHFDITVDLMQAGIHCLVVKPLAPTADQVAQLAQLAGRKGLYGAVEFHKRFDRCNLKLKDTIAGGRIGDPLYFAVEYSQRKHVALSTFCRLGRTHEHFPVPRHPLPGYHLLRHRCDSAAGHGHRAKELFGGTRGGHL